MSIHLDVGACVALIVAAGRGLRAGGGMPKQYRPLAGKPLLRRTIEAFLDHPGIDSVCCVIHPDDAAPYADATQGLVMPPPSFGGETRQDSVRNGLEGMTAVTPARVLIHDAARPFVSARLIGAVAAALDSHAAAIPGVAVADTVKRVAGGLVEETIPRTALVRVQTPQGFRFGDILRAHRTAAGAALTDDAAVAEAAGIPVHVVPGDEDNIKVTEPDDFIRAERRLAGFRTIRVGSGFDVHAFAPGDHVMLCGVAVPHEFGLLGHSDADVGLHALTDAILGAIADGDIGSHFPPSDPRWRGADSARFLRHAAELAAAVGGRIEHIDITLICERPKVGPHAERMRALLAEDLAVEIGAISIKATTTEKLGFTGRGEGIAAMAVVVLMRA